MHGKTRFLFRWCVLAGVLAAIGVGPVAAADPFVEPEAVALHTLTGEEVGDSFGWLAENIGDITGDGVNEFITTAPSNTENGSLAGKIYVYSGLGGPPLHTALGNPSEIFGWSGSRAGDVNNDGVPDYIVGGIGTSAVAGRVAVYSGADHAVLHEWTGNPGELFGSGAAGAGDVNRDGYGDLIVGAQFVSANGARAGRIYLFSGRDGALLWLRDGAAAGDRLGSAVGLVGDVNHDGVPDQVAGAMGAGRKGGGAAYVFSGVDGSIIYTLHPTGNPVLFGRFFALGAGDVNGDGTPDIFVADYNARRGANDLDDPLGLGTGRAYVFSGADGSRLLVLNAEQKNDGFGPGRGVGDVNRDGYGDLIVAAYSSSDGAPLGGKAYLYSGRDGSIIRTFTSSLANEFLGVDAIGIGDTNGDGLTDYVLTGFGATLGHVYIVAGTP
ncbi:MAG TPA: integrin alpha [Herpetosiphonaceae bacterium]